MKEQIVVWQVILLCFFLITSIFILFIFIYFRNALFSLYPIDYRFLHKNNRSLYRRILFIVRNKDQYLITYYVVLQILFISIILIFNILFSILFRFFFNNWYIEWCLKIFLITFMILSFTDFLPRFISANKNKKRFMYFIPVVFNFFAFFYTLSKHLKKINKYLIKPSKIQEKIKEEKAELIDLIDKNFSQSSFEKKILKRTLEFHQLQVKQIMRTKLDVIALNFEASSAEIINQLLNHKYSRYPVYKESIDQIVGILFAKDVLFNKEQLESNWHSLIQPVYYILESKKIEELLIQFDQKCIHFAVVINEYSETEGIVTLEDILEEIVGEIEDEYSNDSQDILQLDSENYLIDGKMLIVDFEKYFSFQCEHLLSNDSGVHTMAGFYIERSQTIPHLNDKIILPSPTMILTMTIQEIEKYRISKFLIHLSKNEN